MPRTVLIVEDVDTCASTLEIAFSGIEDVDVVTAVNAEEALKLLEHGWKNVRAIVTDLHMRGMDGFELIERVRSHRDLGNMPIIVITGCSDPDTPERAIELGANAFFAKPYSPMAVREKLEQLLKNEMSMS
jgi:CheY-like chemotaxis protein